MATFDPTEPEQWYPIPGADGYEISSHFQVRSWLAVWAGRVSKPRLIEVTGRFTKGYLAFQITRGGTRRTLFLHHVVALLSHGPKPSGLGVLHRDDNKLNNMPSNLYYGTPLQNSKDSCRNGRHRKGEARPDAKLTDALAMEIYNAVLNGEQQKTVARRFGVCAQTVWDIKTKRTWAHIHQRVGEGTRTPANQSHSLEL